MSSRAHILSMTSSMLYVVLLHPLPRAFAKKSGTISLKNGAGLSSYFFLLSNDDRHQEKHSSVQYVIRRGKKINQDLILCKIQ